MGSMEGRHSTCLRVSLVASSNVEIGLTSRCRFGAQDRASTASEPFILIERAVHHWDENGVDEPTAELPPLAVKDTQSLEQFAVEEWMQEWKLHCLRNGGCS